MSASLELAELKLSYSNLCPPYTSKIKDSEKVVSIVNNTTEITQLNHSDANRWSLFLCRPTITLTLAISSPWFNFLFLCFRFQSAAYFFHALYTFFRLHSLNCFLLAVRNERSLFKVWRLLPMAQKLFVAIYLNERSLLFNEAYSGGFCWAFVLHKTVKNARVGIAR